MAPASTTALVDRRRSPRLTAARLRTALPAGGRLAEADWQRRHSLILQFQIGFIAAVAAVGIANGYPLLHWATDAGPSICLAVCAAQHRRLHVVASSCATLGMLLSAATVVHLTGGLIEAHVLFVIAVMVVTLYQEWLPLVEALVFTATHHAVLGSMSPNSVFNHAAAQGAPLKWAAVHSFFIFVAAAVGVVGWKANEEQSLQDPLTRLPNRTMLLERARAALAMRDVCSLLYLDLCLFKQVNDRLGHDAGDEVLREVGYRLQACVGESDTVARLGGDEFGVVLPGADRGAGLAVAERVRVALSETAIAGSRIAASVGVTTSRPGDTAEALLRQGDLAMYEAKRRSGEFGNVALFDDLLEEEALDRAGLEADLEVALRHDRLQVHYQPVVDIASGEICGFEALARWHDAARGDVPPTVFIPVAERARLIGELGEWVLRKATHQLRRWRDAVPSARSLTMSVNVSSRQLGSPGFVDSVRHALSDAQLPPESLVLEVTESALVEDSDVAVLRQVADLGVILALDDFGTGYSSLSYLQRLPIRVIKIDRAFTSSVPGGHNEQLTASVFAMAECLGMKTVVEGVEEAEQVPPLIEMGAVLAQGFYFDRPMTAGEAFERIRDAVPVAALSPSAQASREVLVLEDDDIVAAVLSRHLIRAGCHPVRARSADEAWQIVVDARPSAILCDINLPGPDGWSLIDRIRSEPALADIGVLVVSGITDEDTHRRAARARVGVADKSDLALAVQAAVASLPKGA